MQQPYNIACEKRAQGGFSRKLTNGLPGGRVGSYTMEFCLDKCLPAMPHSEVCPDEKKVAIHIFNSLLNAINLSNGIVAPQSDSLFFFKAMADILD